jgi:predicted lipoprotein with Yx(FWY)xxD motif
MNARRIAALAVLLAGAGTVAVAAPGAATDHPGMKAKAATVDLRSTKLGKVLADSKGRTLYLFEKDRNDKSACAGACAKVWQPLMVSSKPTAGAGVKAALLGTTRRKSGAQVTYNRHPLYTFTGDKKAGQTTGEGSKAFGAEWYVLSAKGSKVEKKGGS